MRRPLAVIALALSAVLVACGGSNDKYSRADYVGAAMAQFSPSGAPISSKQAKCFIGEVVDGIGVHQLNEDGVTPKQFASAKTPAKYIRDADARKRVVAQVIKGDCFGLDLLIIPALKQAFGTVLSDQDAACLAKELVKAEKVRTALANGILGLSGGPSLSTVIQGQTVGAIKACSLNPLSLLKK